MTEAEQIMKRCQIGTRNYEEANNLHAACYGMIGKLLKQRKWVGLTKDEQSFIYDQVKQIVDSKPFWVRFADAIEAKLKELNT
jgi:hypothetical protein